MFSNFALSCAYDWCNIHPAHALLWLVIVVAVLILVIRKIHKSTNMLGIYLCLALIVVAPLLIVAFNYYSPLDIAMGQTVIDSTGYDNMGTCPDRFCDFRNGLSGSLLFTAASVTYVLVTTFAITKVYTHISKNHKK